MDIIFDELKCFCGCKNKTTFNVNIKGFNKYINGHNHTGKKNIKMSERLKGNNYWKLVDHKNIEYREKIKNINTGRKRKDDHDIIILKNSNEICSYGCNKQALYFFIKSKKYCCSKSQNSCSFMIEQNRKNTKNKFLDEEYCKNFSGGCNMKPNKLEILISKLLENTNFKYVGDFKKFIGRKNPDFIDDKNKKIIEFFGDHWHGIEHRSKNHNDFKSNEEHEIEKIDHYKNNGYAAIVIWEKELNDMNLLKDKILNFSGDN